MEDEPNTASPAPASPSPEEDAEAEDTTPQDAPAEPAEDPDESAPDIEEPSPPRDDAPPSASHDLPRTTTTGDDAEDLRAAGDGAVSGAPGDDLDDSGQRHATEVAVQAARSRMMTGIVRCPSVLSSYSPNCGYAATCRA